MAHLWIILDAMPKRRKDADTRRFFDEFQSVRVSRLRANGTIDPSKLRALIPFPDGSTKLINTAHVRFPNGGGWSLFRCPKCDRRATLLYLIGKSPRCTICCQALNIRHRSAYAFGRHARRMAKDRQLDLTIAKLETTEPLRLRPAPASWRGKTRTISRSRDLSLSMRKRMVELRLNQIADQWTPGDQLVSHRPTAAARQLIATKPIWRASSSETLQKALDKAQCTILRALESHDPQQRHAAAVLMMRTKQARERGLR
jgi:hypothetical protein